MFESGSDILRLGDFWNYNQFSWNAYRAPSIGPDVSHPHFQFDFPKFTLSVYRFLFCFQFSHQNSVGQVSAKSVYLHKNFFREIAMFTSRLLSFNIFFCWHHEIHQWFCLKRLRKAQFPPKSRANPGEVSMDSNSLDKILKLLLNTLPRTLAP